MVPDIPALAVCAENASSRLGDQYPGLPHMRVMKETSQTDAFNDNPDSRHFRV
jgi:hypothetical protein